MNRREADLFHKDPSRTRRRALVFARSWEQIALFSEPWWEVKTEAAAYATVTNVGAAPLVVDLDGTLVATDTLWEQILVFLRRNPFGVFSLIVWAFAGKAQFKEKLSARASLDVENLPYRTDFLDWLRAEKLSGRSILLATGADSAIASAVAAQLRLFDGVIASDGKASATGDTKSRMIAETLSGQPFDYAGNAMIDVRVWRHSQNAIVVAPDRGVLAALRRQNIVVTQTFVAPNAGVPGWAKALRIHQWVKNLLIFTPLLTSHRIFDVPGLAHAACGFFVFSLVASSTYLINDLLDLPADRRHVTKRNRPLAAGLIPIPTAILAALLLLSGAALFSFWLPWPAAALVFGYAASTLLYSLVLKRLLMVDVVALALFYTARLMYGGLVTSIEISIWTLAFCAFSFSSLAAVKRINDLAKANLQGLDSLPHRAYQAQDLNALVALAASTSNIAVLVLILYINSQQGEKLYRHPQFLWAMCVPLLYWFSRILLLANRGKLADDPILFATKDRATYLVFALMALITIAAT
jgi:4-hydroxybenzoate polyprenyltransferase